MSRSDEPSEIFLPYKKNQNHGNFRFLRADLNNDFEKIIGTINEFRPDYVADFAGQGMVAQSWSAPEQWMRTNILSKVRLHDELRKMDWLKKYMRVSTPEVYGSTGSHIKEDSPLDPSTPYAVSHAAIDMSLKAFLKQYDFPVVFSRSANFYGPGQHLFRIIPRTIIYARIGKKLKLDGGGTSIRSFIYAEDFCRASWKLMTEAEPGEVIHIADDEYVSIRQLVEKICSHLEIQLEDLAEVGEERPGKDHAYYMDCSHLKEKFSWKTEVSLDEGIQKTIEWVDQSLDVIKTLPLEYIHKA